MSVLSVTSLLTQYTCVRVCVLFLDDVILKINMVNLLPSKEIFSHERIWRTFRHGVGFRAIFRDTPHYFYKLHWFASPAVFRSLYSFPFSAFAWMEGLRFLQSLRLLTSFIVICTQKLFRKRNKYAVEWLSQLGSLSGTSAKYMKLNSI